MATELLTAPNERTTARTALPVDTLPIDVSSAAILSEATIGDEVSRQTVVWRDCLQLSKPRIVTMILITTIATGIIGARGMFSLANMIELLFGTAMVAASAGAANQIWERVIDRKMPRTANRPLPDGRMRLPLALALTSVTLFIGTIVLAWRFGWVPAAVGLATWISYVAIYTPMKTRSAWNTTVGAIAGALPMLIGYTATGGSLSEPTGWLLVALSIAWQYPHFMAIAWMYRRQYAEAGFQMTTTVEPTGRDAAIQSVAGSIVLILVGLALVASVGSTTYALLGGLGVIAAGWPVLRASIGFARARDDAAARKLLRSSLLVLPVVLLITTIGVFW
jgi:heme o synthase